MPRQLPYNNAATAVAGASRTLSSSAPDPSAYEKFNTNLMSFLMRAQANPNLGTAKFQEASSLGREAMGRETHTPLSEEIQGMGFSPSQIQSMRGAKAGAYEPQARIAGEMGKTYGEQIQSTMGGIRDVLEQSRLTADRIKTEKRQDKQDTLAFIDQQFDQFGSKAFVDSSPEELVELEKAAGLPSGYLSSRRSTLTEQSQKLDRLKFLQEQQEGDSDLNKLLSPNEAASLNVPYGTTRRQAAGMGVTPKATLTGQDKIDTELKLAGNLEKYIKDYRGVSRQVGLINSSYKNAIQNLQKGVSINQAAQGILVTFQKILDPTSVVRESEYARSAAGLSVLGRLEGLYTRIQSGGPGVGPNDLKLFVDLGNDFLENYQQEALDKASLIQTQAENYGLNLENIVTPELMNLLTGTKKGSKQEQKEYYEYLISQGQFFTSAP